MYTFYFEKLEVWENARNFAKNIYELTSSFPEEGKFGITIQIRRAAVSITANIAEGFSRNTQKDKARFINQSYSSTLEVVNFLILSKDLKFITEVEYVAYRKEAEEISNKLNALYKTLK